MSTQPKEQFDADLISEESVHAYLSDNPDFFERHGDLLRALRLPHVSGGTVSLVERQVTALRQRDSKLEQQLKDLLEVARDNDLLARKIHTLSLQLLATTTLAETIETCETALRTGFDADQAVLVIFRDAASFSDIELGRFLRPVDREDPAMQAFATILKRSSPRCGQIRDAQRDFLFGEATNEIGSCALVPLGEKCEIGFLAIGSADADRFHPGMSIDFITRLGELIGTSLSRY